MAVALRLALVVVLLPSPAARLLRFHNPSGCVPPAQIVEAMTANPSDPYAQRVGCEQVNRCVPSSSKESQDAAAAAGVLEAVISAMRRFPEERLMQRVCIGAASKPILFNRENSLRAGRLGGLNLTLAAYARWMDDLHITSSGGSIGCYLDYSNENRAILRELGGVQLLIQNIKNNFHGQYSDWSFEPVKNSLFGLSSGCWKNQDLCRQEGFMPLAVQLMKEHGAEDKIAEETLQAVKALTFYSDAYRRELADIGIIEAMVKVLQDNPTDRGAISLVCQSLRFLVGPATMTGPTVEFAFKDLDPQIQATAVQAGAIEQLLTTTMSSAQLRHKGHGAFNFNIDEAYNAQADCLDALLAMSTKSEENAMVMLKAGLADHLAGKVAATDVSLGTRRAACRLLRSLAGAGRNETAKALARQAAGKCGMR